MQTIICHNCSLKFCLWCSNRRRGGRSKSNLGKQGRFHKGNNASAGLGGGSNLSSNELNFFSQADTAGAQKQHESMTEHEVFNEIVIDQCCQNVEWKKKQNEKISKILQIQPFPTLLARTLTQEHVEVITPEKMKVKQTPAYFCQHDSLLGIPRSCNYFT